MRWKRPKREHARTCAGSGLSANMREHARVMAGSSLNSRETSLAREMLETVVVIIEGTVLVLQGVKCIIQTQWPPMLRGHQ